MRLPSLIRTLYAFTNTAFLGVRAQAPLTIGGAARPGIALRASMPTIPFLGSLFSTADTRKMSHPVQKTDQEWQAVLNKGT